MLVELDNLTAIAANAE